MLTWRSGRRCRLAKVNGRAAFVSPDFPGRAGVDADVRRTNEERSRAPLAFADAPAPIHLGEPPRAHGTAAEITSTARRMLNLPPHALQIHVTLSRRVALHEAQRGAFDEGITTIDRWPILPTAPLGRPTSPAHRGRQRGQPTRAAPAVEAGRDVEAARTAKGTARATRKQNQPRPTTR